MKYWILPSNDSNDYAVVGASKKPTDAVCEAPKGATTSDGQYISIVDEIDEYGSIKKIAQLNETQKAVDGNAQQAAKDAVQYQLDRKRAYPPIGDQLDALYKKLHLNDSTDWDNIVDQITQVKLDYPKPE